MQIKFNGSCYINDPWNLFSVSSVKDYQIDSEKSNDSTDNHIFLNDTDGIIQNLKQLMVVQWFTNDTLGCCSCQPGTQLLF